MNVKLLERVTELTKDMEVFEYVNPGLQPRLNDKIQQIENGITELGSLYVVTVSIPFTTKLYILKRYNRNSLRNMCF